MTPFVEGLNPMAFTSYVEGKHIHFVMVDIQGAVKEFSYNLPAEAEHKALTDLHLVRKA